jgi:hypothetical protein
MSLLFMMFYLVVYGIGFILSMLCGLIFELSTQQEDLSSTESRGLFALWSFSVAVTCVSPLLAVLLVTMEVQTSWVYDIPVMFALGMVQSIAVFPWLNTVLMRWIVTEDG